MEHANPQNDVDFVSTAIEQWQLARAGGVRSHVEVVNAAVPAPVAFVNDVAQSVSQMLEAPAQVDRQSACRAAWYGLERITWKH